MAMIYDITDKLKFNEDPVIRVKNTELTVRSDADVLLQIMDVMHKKSEMEAAVESMALLFSEQDQKKIKKLHLKIEDFMTFIEAAVKMALGEDPDEEEEKN